MKNNTEYAITSLKTINIHYTINFPSEVYTLIQLENNFILAGLGNGSLYFFNVNNIQKPFFILNVDDTPITNILQLKNGTIVCATKNPSICTIVEHPQNKNEYEVDKRINIKIQGHQINKIIELENNNIISIDNAYISLWSNKFDLIKEKKINSPIIDIILLNKNKFVCALPLKKCLKYFESEKLNQEYEIKNIKFIQSLDLNNNLIYKEFVANIKLRNEKEIITSVYNLINGDLLCGGSLVFDDNNNKVVKVESDLIQFQYRQYKNSFKEIARKKGLHENIIRDIKEIINHKKMKEVVTVSLDGTIILLNN